MSTNQVNSPRAATASLPAAPVSPRSPVTAAAQEALYKTKYIDTATLAALQNLTVENGSHAHTFEPATWTLVGNFLKAVRTSYLATEADGTPIRSGTYQSGSFDLAPVEAAYNELAKVVARDELKAIVRAAVMMFEKDIKKKGLTTEESKTEKANAFFYFFQFKQGKKLRQEEIEIPDAVLQNSDAPSPTASIPQPIGGASSEPNPAPTYNTDTVHTCNRYNIDDWSPIDETLSQPGTFNELEKARSATLEDLDTDDTISTRSEPVTAQELADAQATEPLQNQENAEPAVEGQKAAEPEATQPLQIQAPQGYSTKAKLLAGLTIASAAAYGVYFVANRYLSQGSSIEPDTCSDSSLNLEYLTDSAKSFANGLYEAVPSKEAVYDALSDKATQLYQAGQSFLNRTVEDAVPSFTNPVFGPQFNSSVSLCDMIPNQIPCAPEIHSSSFSQIAGALKQPVCPASFLPEATLPAPLQTIVANVTQTAQNLTEQVVANVTQTAQNLTEQVVANVTQTAQNLTEQVVANVTQTTQNLTEQVVANVTQTTQTLTEKASQLLADSLQSAQNAAANLGQSISDTYHNTLIPAAQQKIQGWRNNWDTCAPMPNMPNTSPFKDKDYPEPAEPTIYHPYHLDLAEGLTYVASKTPGVVKTSVEIISYLAKGVTQATGQYIIDNGPAFVDSTYNAANIVVNGAYQLAVQGTQMAVDSLIPNDLTATCARRPHVFQPISLESFEMPNQITPILELASKGLGYLSQFKPGLGTLATTIGTFWGGKKAVSALHGRCTKVKSPAGKTASSPAYEGGTSGNLLQSPDDNLITAHFRKPEKEDLLPQDADVSMRTGYKGAITAALEAGEKKVASPEPNPAEDSEPNSPTSIALLAKARKFAADRNRSLEEPLLLPSQADLKETADSQTGYNIARRALFTGNKNISLEATGSESAANKEKVNALLTRAAAEAAKGPRRPVDPIVEENTDENAPAAAPVTQQGTSEAKLFSSQQVALDDDHFKPDAFVTIRAKQLAAAAPNDEAKSAAGSAERPKKRIITGIKNIELYFRKKNNPHSQIYLKSNARQLGIKYKDTDRGIVYTLEVDDE